VIYSFSISLYRVLYNIEYSITIIGACQGISVNEKPFTLCPTQLLSRYNGAISNEPCRKASCWIACGEEEFL